MIELICYIQRSMKHICIMEIWVPMFLCFHNINIHVAVVHCPIYVLIIIFSMIHSIIFLQFHHIIIVTQIYIRWYDKLSFAFRIYTFEWINQEQQQQQQQLSSNIGPLKQTSSMRRRHSPMGDVRSRRHSPSPDCSSVNFSFSFLLHWIFSIIFIS